MQLILINIQESDQVQTMDEIIYFLNDKLKDSLDVPLYIDILCNNCEEPIFSYEPYSQKIPIRKITCLDCRTLNITSNCTLKNVWECPEGLTYRLLEDLNNMGVILKEWYGWCYNCSKSDVINYIKYPVRNNTNKKELESYLSNLYCKECKSIYEIIPLYRHNVDNDISFWKDGYWLEWYVKKLCEKSFPKSIVEQGIILSKNGNQIEIDVCVLKSGKSYGIECKASSPYKTSNLGDVANVLKYKGFVDESLLVLTGKLNDHDETYLLDSGINIIHRADIEKVGLILRGL